MDIAGIVTAILMFALGVWKYNDEKKKRNLEITKLELENQKLRDEKLSLSVEHQENKIALRFYDDIVRVIFENALKPYVEEIFRRTKVTRFLLLIARNGIESPKRVDVRIDFFKDKENEIDAVRMYTNVVIDNEYRDMIYKMKRDGRVDLETNEMEEQLLKYFYLEENIKFSSVRNLFTTDIDGENKAVIFTSSATHVDEAFTNQEQAFVDLMHQNSIKPTIEKILSL